jgi:two-component system NarL family response regulator
MTIRAVLVDDHEMMREGLRSILKRIDDLEIVGEAADGPAAVDLAGRLNPDIVVMDVGMADLNGIDATRRIKAANPNTLVIGLSMHSDRHYVVSMLDAGASGYVLKGAAGNELILAINAARKGESYLSPAIKDVVAEPVGGEDGRQPDTVYSKLGSREREVLQLLAQGNASKEIAMRMHISVRTVETHRRNIMQKLDLHSVADLVKYAVRQGLVRLEG